MREERLGLSDRKSSFVTPVDKGLNRHKRELKTNR